MYNPVHILSLDAVFELLDASTTNLEGQRLYTYVATMLLEPLHIIFSGPLYLVGCGTFSSGFETFEGFRLGC